MGCGVPRTCVVRGVHSSPDLRGPHRSLGTRGQVSKGPGPRGLSWWGAESRGPHVGGWPGDALQACPQRPRSPGKDPAATLGVGPQLGPEGLPDRGPEPRGSQGPAAFADSLLKVTSVWPGVGRDRRWVTGPPAWRGPGRRGAEPRAVCSTAGRGPRRLGGQLQTLSRRGNGTYRTQNCPQNRLRVGHPGTPGCRTETRAATTHPHPAPAATVSLSPRPRQPCPPHAASPRPSPRPSQRAGGVASPFT